MGVALSDVLTMHRFAGIELITVKIADETTIPSFRHLLEKQVLPLSHRHRLMQETYRTAPFGLGNPQSVLVTGKWPRRVPF